MIGVLILTHGSFGEDLLKTASVIMKDNEKILSHNISRRLDFETLRLSVVEKIKGLQADSGVLVLIDAYGGTSYNTTLPLVKEHKVSLVTGVNLPMVLSALTNRSRLSLRDLAVKVAEDAKKTISVLTPEGVK